MNSGDYVWSELSKVEMWQPSQKWQNMSVSEYLQPLGVKMVSGTFWPKQSKANQQKTTKANQTNQIGPETTKQNKSFFAQFWRFRNFWDAFEKKKTVSCKKYFKERKKSRLKDGRNIKLFYLLAL